MAQPTQEQTTEKIRKYLGALVAPLTDGHFVRVSQSVPVGHTFDEAGKTFRVDWCQPGKGCWVVMLTEVE